MSPAIRPLPERPPIQAPSVEEPVIPLSSLAPYFDTPTGDIAALALAEDRLPDAIAGFDAIASDFSHPDIALRADFLASYLSYYNGNDERPLQRLPELAPLLPVLSDVAHEVAGLAAFRSGLYPQAIALAERITHDSMTRQMLLADARRRQGRIEEALALYRQAAMRWSLDERHHEARARIVECAHALSMEQMAGVDPRAGNSPPPESTDESTPSFAVEQEALDIIEALVAWNPTDYWTRHAVRFEEALRARTGAVLPEKRKESALAEELFEQARADMKKRRNARAEERYEKAIRAARDGGELQCQARYELALTVSFLRRHSEAADLFMEAAQHCNSPRLKIRSLYKGGEASMAADRFLDAIRLFGQVEELFPEHSFADDARLHTARAHLAMGQPDEFMRLVASIPEDYPDGDMCGEALWQGARHTMDRGEPEKALDLLSRYYSLFPIEPGWYTAGRSGYWLARLEEQLGHLEDALSHYEYVVATAPLSYYMILSYARLRELDSTRAELLLAQLAPSGGREPEGIPARLVASPSAWSWCASDSSAAERRCCRKNSNGRIPIRNSIGPPRPCSGMPVDSPSPGNSPRPPQTAGASDIRRAAILHPGPWPIRRPTKNW
jgi:tetratricopeptide (TPR) repeat protein